MLILLANWPLNKSAHCRVPGLHSAWFCYILFTFFCDVILCYVTSVLEGYNPELHQTRVIGSSSNSTFTPTHHENSSPLNVSSLKSTICSTGGVTSLSLVALISSLLSMVVHCNSVYTKFIHSTLFSLL